MLRFVVREHGQPELPAIDRDGRVVIGSGAGAHVRLPAAAARPEHVVIENGRWRALAEVKVDGVVQSAGAIDATVAGGGGERGITFELGTYRVRVARAPTGVAASPPQRTESLARELMRNLMGDGAAPALTIENGPHAGTRRALPPPEARVVIGRGEDVDWSILDEDLSRQHAELRRGWDGTTLRDLGSQNGTRVDGVLVTEPVALGDGARIELGNVVLVYSDPAERHLKNAVTPVKPRVEPAVPSRQSIAPFAIAVAIAVLAAIAFVLVVAA